METKFLICKHCGNIVEVIRDSGVSIVCCGEKMNELKANTTDGAVEKHVPVVNIDGNKVEVVVGSTLHPMVEAHYIQWIYLKTDKGVQKKYLSPSDEPKAEFVIGDDEKVIEAYEYCNLHGLWKKEI
ncbi:MULTISPECIES: desulfoferrodoxin family protein [Clostridium]|uniref:desulfoferrodoxin family protein n=1 Tax=Clostridium TaxID=1485 RepID=UPI002671B5C4|nr:MULTISPECIES: desulfoferrodoxin family protein [Clostridium]MDU4145345.1 desulfoferrodoxin family protein [Clostridium sp.]MDU4318546.1 desulfoferrodoxin family protein [Clostridium sp.]